MDSEVFVSCSPQQGLLVSAIYKNIQTQYLQSFCELTSSAWDALTKAMRLVPLWKHYRKMYFPSCYCTSWSFHTIWLWHPAIEIFDIPTQGFKLF